MELNLFSNHGKNSVEHLQSLKSTVISTFNLDDDSIVLITELRCGEPGCPPLETVIGILSQGPLRQFKIQKSIEEVTKDDIHALRDKP